MMKSIQTLLLLGLVTFPAIADGQEQQADDDTRIIEQLLDSREERAHWQSGEIKLDIDQPAITVTYQPGDVPPALIRAWPATENDFNVPLVQIESDFDNEETLYRLSEAEYNVLLAIHQRAADAELPAWQPLLGEAPDFSEVAQAQYREWAENEFGDPQDPDDFWYILGPGCSWYCGGGPESVSASSTLAPQGDFTYDADNAHDLRYDTAWVEGVDGPGIGETLTYHFANESPRITEIIIHNGYIKSPEAWLNNNRVRSLRLRINGEPIALLSLADERGAQSFGLEALGLDPLGRREDGDDLVLTFEIIEVYPGEKHDDTAISEVYFDGIDVH